MKSFTVHLRSGICAGLLLGVVACGPRDEPSAPLQTPSTDSIRIVEQVHPGEAWREIKVQLGHETRNALFAHARVPSRTKRPAADGTLGLSELIAADTLHPEAVGVLVTHAAMGAEARDETNLLAELASEQGEAAIDAIRVAVGGADDAQAQRRVRAREVLPSLWQFASEEVVIPEQATLSFAIGIEAGLLLDDDGFAAFRVGVIRDGEPIGLFEEALDPRASGEADRWHTRSVDLSAYAGARVRIAFESETLRPDRSPLAGATLLAPVFGNPVVKSGASPPASRPPNVILISLDTLRADHLGSYGYALETSPNLDAFAEGAILFEKAIAPSSWTTPSHASIFTGLHPGAHGAGLERVGNRMRPELTTLAEVARAHGFQTAAYTEGGAVRASFGFQQGFDQYSDGPSRRHYRLAGRTFDDATEWLEQNADQPFLLFVHTYEPHVPYIAPRKFWRRFSDVEPTTEMQKDPYRFRDELPAWYDAEVAYTDHVVGVFLDRLEEMDLLENSLVVVFSDHGEELFDHGSVGHRSHLYEEVLHVPLILRLPGQQPRAGRVERLVTTTDLFGTIVDFMEWDVGQARDSMSLLPLIRGADSAEVYARDLVHSLIEIPLRDHGLGEEVQIRWSANALRTLDEKYIRTSKPWVTELALQGVAATPDDVPDYSEAFFDMTRRPAELENLAAQHPDRVLHFRGLLERRLGELESRRRALLPEASTPDALSAAELADLEALGYL